MTTSGYIIRELLAAGKIETSGRPIINTMVTVEVFEVVRSYMGREYTSTSEMVIISYVS